MASGGKRKGGERVLEGRHVIGLFLLMLLFSGVFFTLGYVMGRNQYDGQVRAATTSGSSSTGIAAFRGDSSLSSNSAKRTANKTQTPAADPSTDNSTPVSSDWEFYKAGEPKKTEDHLDHLSPATPAPAASPNPAPVLVKSTAPPKTNSSPAKSLVSPAIPGGAYTLQVAALTKEADAMDLAKHLQKKKFPAFVASSKGDKYYRVQVGPYADQKTADAAKKGLDAAGFKAIVKH